MTMLKEYTKEEYLSDIRKKIDTKGMYKTVEEVLDEIVEDSIHYGYDHYSFVAEKANDILKIVELVEQKNGGLRNVEA